MVSQVIRLFDNVFGSVATWFSQIINAVQGMEFIIIAFVMSITVSLLITSLRGIGSSSYQRYYTKNKTYKIKKKP